MNAVTESLPVPAAQSDTGSLLNLIASMMADPTADVNKLKMLLGMQREIIADERRIAFHRAMRLAQAEMRPVLRNADNTTTNSRYVTFDQLDRAIRPVYTRHGFSVTCDSETIEGGVRIWCEVAHDAGHTKIINAEAALDTVGPKGTQNKTAIHGWKSALQYLRRGTLEMAFNLSATNDDDGNAAGKVHDGEIISRPQAAELRQLVAECSRDPKAAEANERQFLIRMQLGDLASIEHVQPKDFNRLRTALLCKRERLGRAA